MRKRVSRLFQIANAANISDQLAVKNKLPLVPGTKKIRKTDVQFFWDQRKERDDYLFEQEENRISTELKQKHQELINSKKNIPPESPAANEDLDQDVLSIKPELGYQGYKFTDVAGVQFHKPGGYFNTYIQRRMTPAHFKETESVLQDRPHPRAPEHVQQLNEIVEALDNLQKSDPSNPILSYSNFSDDQDITLLRKTNPSLAESRKRQKYQAFMAQKIVYEKTLKKLTREQALATNRQMIGDADQQQQESGDGVAQSESAGAPKTREELAAIRKQKAYEKNYQSYMKVRSLVQHQGVVPYNKIERAQRNIDLLGKSVKLPV